MNQLIALARKVLDKTDQLLTTEPARLIGYGAAVVVVITAQVLGHIKPGLLPQVGFNEALGLSLSAIAALVTIVESIRRFVYSPLTYIEDLSDEAHAAHEAAHLEEDLRRWTEAVQAEQAKPQTQTVTVGSAQADGSSGKAN